ncbi:MAG: hypothetical protein C0483_02245 [Pirellula sp.]|nr:hypothetical protein [Pirellula sp.]
MTWLVHIIRLTLCFATIAAVVGSVMGSTARGQSPTLTEVPNGRAADGLWLDNLPVAQNFSLFAGLEGSKQPQDFGVNAAFGGRVALDGAIPLWRDAGLGLQFGTSLNATANAVQVTERVEGSTGRTQNFTTLGIFQRLDSGLVWGLGYDVLYQEYYDDFLLTQWRGKVGYRIFPTDEFGVQAAVHDRGDSGSFVVGGVGAVPVTLRPLTQGSFYYRHWFENGAMLGCWFGASQSHGEVNAALGDLPRTGAEFLFGSDLRVPLTSRMSLYGEANFIMPADTGTVDAFLGFEFRFAGGSYTVGRNRFAPLLSTSGSTTMSVDMRR